MPFGVNATKLRAQLSDLPMLFAAAIVASCFTARDPLPARSAAGAASSKASLPPMYTRVDASVSLRMSIATVDTVAGALEELFNSYDTDRKGYITLSDFTSTWTAGRDVDGTDGEWEARQARAGARRIRRLFSCDPEGCAVDVTKAEFVDHFQTDYDKRMTRGLAERRAVTEILCNIPKRALFAEMYGSE